MNATILAELLSPVYPPSIAPATCKIGARPVASNEFVPAAQTITPSDKTLKSTTLHPYALGASLYMPATRGDIWQVISRAKLPTLNTVIICLEDAVSEGDVTFALNNLEVLLKTWADDEGLSQTPYQYSQRPLVFIRPRNPHILLQLTTMQHIDLVDGFVLPKVDMDSLSAWRMVCQQLRLDSLLMPTLETKRMFDTLHNQDLVTALDHAFDERVFALRIGGNDLFACLRQRRPNHQTIYDTTIGTLIHQLLGTFAAQGYYLTAPVFEYFDRTALFMQELTQDVSLGLVGKTVIHPNQIPLVKQAYCVPESTLAEAKAILDSEAKAVFKHNNTMLEPATHHAWASEIIQRAAVFGVLQNNLL